MRNNVDQFRIATKQSCRLNFILSKEEENHGTERRSTGADA